MADILCLRDECAVIAQPVVCYERSRLILEGSDLARAAAGKYIDTYAFADGRIELRWKGVSLTYRFFDKDQQRVTHAAVTENKRLSAVLAHAMALQQAAPPKVPRAGKQKTIYSPNGRRNDGWSSGLPRVVKQNAAEAAKLDAPLPSAE